MTDSVLRAELASRLRRDFSLSPGDYSVLLALTEPQETRLRFSELAAAIAWQHSRLSHHLKRRERRGLIRHGQSRRRGGAHPARAPESSGRLSCRICARSVSLFVDPLTPEQVAAAVGDIAASLRASLEELHRP